MLGPCTKPSAPQSNDTTTLERLVFFSDALFAIALHAAGARPAVASYACPLWQTRLNFNQNLLGKLLIVLKRHEEQVAICRTKSGTNYTRMCKAAPSACAEPSHRITSTTRSSRIRIGMCIFHVIPRYATDRVVLGLRFGDPDYPGHYAAPGPERRLSPGVLEALKQLLTSSPEPGGRSRDYSS